LMPFYLSMSKSAVNFGRTFCLIEYR